MFNTDNVNFKLDLFGNTHNLNQEKYTVISGVCLCITLCLLPLGESSQGLVILDVLGPGAVRLRQPSNQTK